MPGRARPRGVSTVVGVVALVAIVVVLAATVGATMLTVAPSDTGATVSLSLTATAGDDCIAIEHRGGGTLAPRDLRLEVSVDGEALADQPPIPFFAAAGFESGPTGPFNSATDDTWTAGETGTLRIAGTNDPDIDPGETVRVVVYEDGNRVADLRTTADEGRCRE